ncbi:MAG TPA: glycoside hydrolase family 9 protein, partial [Bacteroidota bacterium]|nr:glycoside hydrolase family 9 protein [Bacteroidota bacterium]
MSKEMWFIFGCILFAMQTGAGQSRESYDGLRLNAAGYFEGPGLNVMAFDDFYPEGHQGGVTIIQCGERVAANGDVRLEPTPGQWSPMPMLLGKRVDREAGTISVTLAYPDTSRDRRGFNPILYPDLSFRYTITTTASDSGVRIVVDLEQPLPRQWADRVGFNLELFPAQYFGEHYLMDGHPGQFPRQVNGPMQLDTSGQVLTLPLAEGRQLIAVPGDETKELRIRSQKSNLQLIDGRALYNNGWFVLRSTIPAGAVRGAVEWTITPRIKPGWRRAPVVQVSQIGYHPRQIKRAVIELDKSTQAFSAIELVRIDGDSERVVLAERSPTPWGTFLRYAYVRFDFSTITQEGLYKVRYGGSESRIFEISRDVYARHVWQPTLEYFLPVQMCHMRVNDRYRVWHGLCHMDDALMAPLNHVHFDGYQQGPSTLTKFRSGEHIPGVNIGGWHDAGDYDIRVESQAETVYKLSLAYELFKNNYDATSIDQTTRIVELHVPDGKPDILQQVEHGVLSIVGAYESMGRLYRGMICPTLRQYVHLGDAATMSDNLIYGPGKTDPVLHQALPMDDRWLFTEENPERELHAAQCLSAASRVLAKYSPQLSARCLRTAKALYAKNRSLP